MITWVLPASFLAFLLEKEERSTILNMRHRQVTTDVLKGATVNRTMAVYMQHLGTPISLLGSSFVYFSYFHCTWACGNILSRISSNCVSRVLNMIRTCRSWEQILRIVNTSSKARSLEVLRRGSPIVLGYETCACAPHSKVSKYALNFDNQIVGALSMVGLISDTNFMSKMRKGCRRVAAGLLRYQCNQISTRLHSAPSSLTTFAWIS
jgi:hypothetical protein